MELLAGASLAGYEVVEFHILGPRSFQQPVMLVLDLSMVLGAMVRQRHDD
jgi:hypothetical protein